jgi:hypothetical protein
MTLPSKLGNWSASRIAESYISAIERGLLPVNGLKEQRVRFRCKALPIL